MFPQTQTKKRVRISLGHGLIIGGWVQYHTKATMQMVLSFKKSGWNVLNHMNEGRATHACAVDIAKVIPVNTGYYHYLLFSYYLISALKSLFFSQEQRNGSHRSWRSQSKFSTNKKVISLQLYTPPRP